jgi:2-oxoglutarate ferredoxin oxidoreductase subunit delta
MDLAQLEPERVYRVKPTYQKPLIARGFHLPFPRHNKTPFVCIDTAKCKACGLCVSACPSHVLGLRALGSHCHVHVDRPANCSGCHSCIAACRRGAISVRERSEG